MLQYVDSNEDQPWRSVVHIETYFSDGTRSGGSGVMVGPNDVLTASHVVYNAQHGGPATTVVVTPAYNPSPLHVEAPFGTAIASSDQLNYFTDANPDGDWYMASGNGGAGFAGVEHDVAVIGLKEPLGNDTGWMELDPTFENGYVNVTGYPGAYGSMVNDFGYVLKDTLDSFIHTERLGILPGNSGGPLWYTASDGSPHVVGIVSTGAWGYDISAEYDTVSSWIHNNDFLMAIV